MGHTTSTRGKHDSCAGFAELPAELRAVNLGNHDSILALNLTSLLCAHDILVELTAQFACSSWPPTPTTIAIGLPVRRSAAVVK